MRANLAEFDKLLRGEVFGAGEPESGGIGLQTRILVKYSLVLGAVYGICMGLYGVMNRGWEGLLQVMASGLKVPLLFVLTLLVTFPSLYVFSALLRSRLRLLQTLHLLAAAIAVNLTVLASLATVLAFFTLSTRSYPFMVLLNVLMFTIAGATGLGFLVRMLRRVFAPPAVEPEPDGVAEDPDMPILSAKTAERSQRSTSADRARTVFRVWLVIYSIVGAQMGWILRPFIGDPNLPFTFFRERWSNFFAEVLRTVGQLFG